MLFDAPAGNFRKHSQRFDLVRRAPNRCIFRQTFFIDCRSVSNVSLRVINYDTISSYKRMLAIRLYQSVTSISYISYIYFF